MTAGKIVLPPTLDFRTNITTWEWNGRKFLRIEQPDCGLLVMEQTTTPDEDAVLVMDGTRYVAFTGPRFDIRISSHEDHEQSHLHYGDDWGMAEQAKPLVAGMGFQSITLNTGGVMIYVFAPKLARGMIVWAQEDESYPLECLVLDGPEWRNGQDCYLLVSPDAYGDHDDCAAWFPYDQIYVVRPDLAPTSDQAEDADYAV